VSTHHGLPVTGRPVPAEHESVVPVEVHRVQRAGVVNDRKLDEVSSLDHEHRHMRKEPPVDGPMPPRPAVEEAELTSDGEFESAVEVARRVERGGGRSAVA